MAERCPFRPGDRVQVRYGFSGLNERYGCVLKCSENNTAVAVKFLGIRHPSWIFTNELILISRKAAWNQ